MSSHQLYATHTSNTLLYTTSRKPRPQVAHNVQSQIKRMPDAVVPGARVLRGGKEP